MINRDEMLNVSTTMIKFGGSFVESLGKTLLQADDINQQKITDTWPEYWQQYKNMGEKIE